MPGELCVVVAPAVVGDEHVLVVDEVDAAEWLGVHGVLLRVGEPWQALVPAEPPGRQTRCGGQGRP